MNDCFWINHKSYRMTEVGGFLPLINGHCGASADAQLWTEFRHYCFDQCSDRNRLNEHSNMSKTGRDCYGVISCRENHRNASCCKQIGDREDSFAPEVQIEHCQANLSFSCDEIKGALKVG